MAVNISIPKFNLRELASKIKQLGSAAFRNVGTQDQDIPTVLHVNQGRKNLIINGDFRVNQRGLPSYVSGGIEIYTLDRWKGMKGTVTPITKGYGHALRFDTIVSTFAYVTQRIEDGYALSGKTVTLSFDWENLEPTGEEYIAYSLENGTVINLKDGITEYLSSNGRKSITFNVPTDGAIGDYLRINFYANQNTTSIGGFDISNVQLEQGSIATPFEYRPIAEELALCQRYYIKLFGGVVGDRYGCGYVSSANNLSVTANLPTIMRAAPTFTPSGIAQFSAATATGTYVSTNVTGIATPFSYNVNITTAGGMTTGQAGHARAANVNAYFEFSAEL